MKIKNGLSISSGIVIGKCFKVDRDKVFVTGYRVKDVEAEVKKLKDAINYTSNAIDATKLTGEAGKINAEVYDAYKLLLEDELFVGQAEALIYKESFNAEYALKCVRDNIIKTLYNSDNEYIRDRMHDIDNIYQRLQRHMMKIAYEMFDNATSNSIIVTSDIILSDIEAMLAKGIKAYATDSGSRVTHSSIIAKSAGLIAVVGLKDLYKNVETGDEIIIDGFLGQVVINPDSETKKRYEKRAEDYNNFLQSFNQTQNTKCYTKCGEEISLFANIEGNSELSLIDVHGLQGVGLYRTEFIYMSKTDINEDEQYNIYIDALRELNNKRLTLRSYDLGGDKVVSGMHTYNEQNPAMGLRAIRYCMANQDIFTKQIRAVLRAAFHGDVWLLLPMISSVDELLEVKAFIAEQSKILVKNKVDHNANIKIGIMIELPAVVMSIDKYIPHVDFFNVGTNDLIQFLIGVDRGNEYVGHLHSSLNHSVLYSLQHLCDRINDSGRELCLCGELASDHNFIPILLGMGYNSFSMNPRSSYSIRNIINMLDIEKCEQLVSKVMDAPTMIEAEKILNNFNIEHINTSKFHTA